MFCILGNDDVDCRRMADVSGAVYLSSSVQRYSAGDYRSSTCSGSYKSCSVYQSVWQAIPRSHFSDSFTAPPSTVRPGAHSSLGLSPPPWEQEFRLLTQRECPLRKAVCGGVDVLYVVNNNARWWEIHVYTFSYSVVVNVRSKDGVVNIIRGQHSRPKRLQCVFCVDKDFAVLYSLFNNGWGVLD